MEASYNYSPNYFGADVYPLTPQLARQDNLSITYGAVISRVNPGSTAEQAGLSSGEVIISVDNFAIHDSLDLDAAVAAIPGYAKGASQLHQFWPKRETTYVTMLSDPYRSTQLFIF